MRLTTDGKYARTTIYLSATEIAALRHHSPIRTERVRVDVGEAGRLYLIYGVTDGAKIKIDGVRFSFQLGAAQTKAIGLDPSRSTQVETEGALTKVLGLNALVFQLGTVAKHEPKRLLGDPLPAIAKPAPAPAPMAGTRPEQVIPALDDDIILQKLDQLLAEPTPLAIMPPIDPLASLRAALADLNEIARAHEAALFVNSSGEVQARLSVTL